MLNKLKSTVLLQVCCLRSQISGRCYRCVVYVHRSAGDATGVLFTFTDQQEKLQVCCLRSQITDIQQEHQREMEGLLENVRQLSRELRQHMLVIDQFTPPEYQVSDDFFPLLQVHCRVGRGWLGSRVVSVLDSGTEGPGFKSRPLRCRVTILGKLFTPTVPLFTKQ